MKIVYIAWPYRASSMWWIQQNIERAREVAFKYWHKGYAVICPHLNTQFMDGEDDSDIWKFLDNCELNIFISES